MTPPGSPEHFNLLLLSGGMDSAALAAWTRPTRALFIDYGQRPSRAEARAASAVARELAIPYSEISVDLTPLGGGLLHDEAVPSGWPSPEWWPYRNQLLVTIAAAWVLKTEPSFAGADRGVVISTGTVATDGRRHVDGTREFYTALSQLVGIQEGNVAVSAPALHLSTVELVAVSGVTDAVLGWTHSCHRSEMPCGECPGCHKRSEVLGELGRLT